MIKANSERSVIKIPYDQLSTETLEALIEEFVARDATDYGETEVSFEQKIKQVKKQLQSEKAIIVFDGSTQTCNIVSRADPLAKDLRV